MDKIDRLRTILQELREKINYAELEQMLDELTYIANNTTFKGPRWGVDDMEDFFSVTLMHISFDLKCADGAIDKALEILNKEEVYRMRLKELGIEPPKKKDIDD